MNGGGKYVEHLGSNVCNEEKRFSALISYIRYTSAL